MPSLELKIPPPVVALLIAVAMWGIAFITPLLEAPALLRACAAVAIALVGVACSVSGIVSFSRARTTVNPHKPEAATSLVTSGIYKFTRNPMYVGLFFLLVAWAVFLSSAWSILGPMAFILYIGRFQIAPEERVLSELFGAEYSSYRARVRRWL
jgi:protein-S-isoprenylcysteine O-methyltransferase Ste14